MQRKPRTYGLPADSGWECSCDCEGCGPEVDCQPLNAPKAGAKCGPCETGAAQTETSRP